MKEIEEKDILKEHEEALDLLERICGRQKSKLLIYFLTEKQGRSKDIERAMDMRQPEVSLGMRELIKDKSVTRQFLKKKHEKGRPEIRYTAITPKKLLDKLEEETTRKLNKMKSNMVKLKALIKEMTN